MNLENKAKELEIAIERKEAKVIFTGDGNIGKMTVVWDDFKNINIADRIDIVKKYKQLPEDFIIEAFAVDEISLSDVVMSGLERLQKQ